MAVEKITLPPDIRQGQPVEARVVLDNYAQRPLSGKLRVTRRLGQREDLLGEQDVELRPGKNVYTFGHKIEQTAVYSYQAEFVPRDPRDDGLTQNNRATAFTHVRGQGRVLLIENWQTPGEFDYLVDRLRQNQIEVTVQTSASLFTSLAELQAYDAVILANVPRSSGDDAQSLHSFSEQQVDMLVRNTEQMGCGLIMLGGPNSFGAGAWSNTALEKAMPVDFQIKNSQLRAVGALAMMMHASEIPEGNYWQKEVAKQAIQSLGPLDYCGLIRWDTGGNRWLWTDDSGNGVARVAERRNMMLRRLGTMAPGDMPEFDPGLRMALLALNRVEASVKLMIVISDGDPSPPSTTVISALRNAGIQVTTVAIGAHGPAGHQTLQELADATGGRYYVVTDARALPKYYVSEVRRVARPLVYEPKTPVPPRVVYSHEILQGIDGPLPPISGFVLTTVKENPLVEVAALSPEPADERNATDARGLDLRPGTHRRPDHGCRSTLGLFLDGVGELRQVLHPTGAVGHAPGRRGGPVHGGHGSARWTCPCRGDRPRQERPVPELPEPLGRRCRSGLGVIRTAHPPGGSGPVRGRVSGHARRVTTSSP